MGVLTLGLMGLPMLVKGAALLLLALSRDRGAGRPLRLVSATIGLDAVGLVLLKALYGAGHSRPVLVVGTAMQWGIGLPLAYLCGPVLGMGLLWMWASTMLYRGGQAAIFAWMWRRRTWTTVSV